MRDVFTAIYWHKSRDKNARKEVLWLFLWAKNYQSRLCIESSRPWTFWHLFWWSFYCWDVLHGFCRILTAIAKKSHKRFCSISRYRFDSQPHFLCNVRAVLAYFLANLFRELKKPLHDFFYVYEKMKQYSKLYLLRHLSIIIAIFFLVGEIFFIF